MTQCYVIIYSYHELYKITKILFLLYKYMYSRLDISGGISTLQRYHSVSKSSEENNINFLIQIQKN